MGLQEKLDKGVTASFSCMCIRKVFTNRVISDLGDIFSKVCRDFGAELIEIDGERDHVHLLVHYPPKVAISKLVNSLKGVSSRMIRKKGYPSVEKALWGGSLWSPSYFAGSCGGAPLDAIARYIQQQDTPMDEPHLTSRP